MTREEKIELLNRLLEIEEKNDIGNLTRAERREFQQWVDDAFESCEDAISRQAVIDMTGLSEWFDSSDSYNEFVIALSELPSVNPQPKTGHWIYDKDTDRAKCSNCGALCFSDNLGRIETQFCHYCGRKMIQK